MTTTQHTPGPWFSKITLSEQGLIYPESGETIALSYNPKNAQLIAAAPDLLDLLQRIVEDDKGWMHEGLMFEAECLINEITLGREIA